MKEEVSVEEALAKGKRMILYPIYAIGALTFFPLWILNPGGIVLLEVLPVTTILLIYFGLYAPVKWRIWAFARVKNLHELKHEAIRGNLIGEDGSTWAGMEIRTAADKQQLAELECKFALPDIKDQFTDDLTVAAETEIRKATNYFVPKVTAVCCLPIIALCVFKGLNPMILVLPISLMAFLILIEVIRGMDKRVQIAINKKGIQVVEGELNKWSEICFEDVILVAEGKTADNYLVFDFINSKAAQNDQGGADDKHDFQFNVEDMDVSQTRLKYLLKIYRGRSEQNSHFDKRSV